MKIEIFTAPLVDGIYNNPLENGHTIFHPRRTEFIDSIVNIGMTIPNTVMIITRKSHPTKLVMETVLENLRQPIFQSTNTTTSLERPKYPIFQTIGTTIGDTILTPMRPLFYFLTTLFLVIQSYKKKVGGFISIQRLSLHQLLVQGRKSKW